MTNNSILLLDPKFDPTSASTCTLLIKVGKDAFSYAIIEQDTNRVQAVFDEQECEDVVHNFTERLRTDPYLKLRYKETKIAMNTSNVLLIPNELYQEENLAVHTRYFSSKLHPNLRAQLQDHFGFTTLFSLPAELEVILENEFPQCNTYHELAGLLSISEQIERSALILDFSVGTMNVLYLNHARVNFQQSYEVADHEELHYYILLLINQLGIDSKLTKLLLSGIVHADDEKYNCLRKYFEDVDFLIVGDHLDKEIVDDMPLHYYSSLLSLYQCE